MIILVVEGLLHLIEVEIQELQRTTVNMEIMVQEEKVEVNVVP